MRMIWKKHGKGISVITAPKAVTTTIAADVVTATRAAKAANTASQPASQKLLLERIGLQLISLENMSSISFKKEKEKRQTQRTRAWWITD
jgi:hypothetical protein